MSHEELRALLPRYAAGTLATPEGDLVRSHLASGCRPCLDALFHHPFGVVSLEPVERWTQLSPPVRSTVPGERRKPVWIAGLVALLTIGLASGWVIATRRSQGVSATEMAGAIERATAAESARASLEAQLRETERVLATATQEREALERIRIEAEAAAARAAAEARMQAARRDEARADLAAAREAADAALAEEVARAAENVKRLEAEREALGAETARLRARAGRGTVGALAATPGVEVLSLTPGSESPGTRGHVLWHPARSQAVVYAFDLPPLAGGGRYRVRVTLDDGRIVAGPTFAPGARGTTVIPVRLSVRATRVRRVDVVRQPDDVAVLTGHVPG